MDGLVEFTGAQLLECVENMRKGCEKRIADAEEEYKTKIAKRRWWNDSYFGWSERISLSVAKERKQELETWVKLAEANPQIILRLPKSDATWFLIK